MEKTARVTHKESNRKALLARLRESRKGMTRKELQNGNNYNSSYVLRYLEELEIVGLVIRRFNKTRGTTMWYLK